MGLKDGQDHFEVYDTVAILGNMGLCSTTVTI